MAVSTLMAAGGCSRFARHLLNGLFALVTPLEALLLYLGAGHFAAGNPAPLGAALAFCAGTFLCIACADLLPELQFHTHDRFKLSLALAAGLVVAILIGKLEASGQHHDQLPGASERSTGLKPAAELDHVTQPRVNPEPLQNQRHVEQRSPIRLLRHPALAPHHFFQTLSNSSCNFFGFTLPSSSRVSSLGLPVRVFRVFRGSPFCSLLFP